MDLQAELPDDADAPVTGLGRAHWEQVADRLLAAAARYRTPRGGRIDLPGSPSRSGWVSDGLEGFARTFLLSALRTAGAGGADPHGHLAGYVEGLAAGSAGVHADPDDGWPPVLDIGRGGQPMVESASVALGLRLTRPWSWDVLDADAQERLATWLRGALTHQPSTNNWYLFPFTVARFLESVGRGDELTRRATGRAEDLLEEWYRGDGWYSDGQHQAFDHYIGWAMHLYPVLDAHLAGDRERLDHLGPRLRDFLVGFAATFDANGAPLFQGRSLTYRFATLAAVGLGALTGWTPLTAGQSRRLLSAGLRYFLDRGALDAEGLLSRGWHGPHAAIVQPYSGPASPYWASKGFLPLLLGADAELWRTPEEPATPADRTLEIAPAGWLVQTTRDGLVRLHNHGSDDVRAWEPDAGPANPLYARLAYSTRTSPTARGNVSDNEVQLEVAGVRSVRRRIHRLGTGPDWAASWHAPRFEDRTAPAAPPGGGTNLPSARIDSLVLARGSVEVRVHRLHLVEPGTRLRVAGWALSGTLDGLTAGTGADRCEVRGAGLLSRLVAVRGLDA
uniref:DUF2264 domain-containing protein n=1 Tax=Desertihabitans aurantiacus TaxID=2282477 RepID=UPI000DF735D4